MDLRYRDHFVKLTQTLHEMNHYIPLLLIELEKENTTRRIELIETLTVEFTKLHILYSEAVISFHAEVAEISKNYVDLYSSLFIARKENKTKEYDQINQDSFIIGKNAENIYRKHTLILQEA